MYILMYLSLCDLIIDFKSLLEYEKKNIKYMCPHAYRAENYLGLQGDVAAFSRNVDLVSVLH